MQPNHSTSSVRGGSVGTYPVGGELKCPVWRPYAGDLRYSTSGAEPHLLTVSAKAALTAPERRR